MKPNLWLAPLHGITSHTFRNTLCRHFGGIDCYVAPFLPVQPAGKFRPKIWQDIAPENNSALPLIPQLMGNQPEHLAETMKMLHERFGYEQFNLNIGCPSSPVVRHTRGCGLMPHPDLVERLVDSAAKTSLRLSLKMRLGLHRADEGRELLLRLNSYPLDFLVIHPRLGEEQYEGHPDLTAFEEFCSVTRHKIVYSGDIFTKGDFQKLSTKFPEVAAWMLGRGMLRNPFLAEEIKGYVPTDTKERFLAFYQELAKELLPIRGENGTLANLKELWHYFALFTNTPHENLQQLLRIGCFQEFMEKTTFMIHHAYANSQVPK